MSETNLERALRELLARERDRWPSRHPQETDECLPLSRLVLSRRDSWTPEEQAHVQACRPYCQRMIAIGWRQGCPDILELIAYTGAREEHALSGAFEFHLDKDQCRWCRAVAASTLAATAPLLRRPSLFGLDFGTTASTVAFVSPLRVAAGLIRLRPARAFGFATDPEPDEELPSERSQTRDERLVWTMYERPDHEVMLEVESPDAADDGRRTKALLSGETEKGDAITEEVDLPALGWNGHLCRNRHALGMAADLTNRFGKEMRVAVWLPEEKR